MRTPQVLAVIPVRFASTRFPGKPLAAETGYPLIQHVHQAVAAARTVRAIIVATDDRRIADAVEGFGGNAVMTSPSHTNGTSRITEAIDGLDLHADDIIVNVQGDEPEIDPSAIDTAVNALAASDAPVATLAAPFGMSESRDDPNVVKVVRRADGHALYFSRGLIPYPLATATANLSGGALGVGRAAGGPLRHVGIYAYRRGFLEHYLDMRETPLEQTERLEQLRILEHGYDIAVAIHAGASHPGIDTPEQYQAFVRRWRERAV